MLRMAFPDIKQVCKAHTACLTNDLTSEASRTTLQLQLGALLSKATYIG